MSDIIDRIGGKFLSEVKPRGMQTLTYDRALELLHKAVDEKGADYVYPDELRVKGDCQYFVDGKPACIVGQVLSYLGVTPDLALEYDIEHSTPTETHLLDLGIRPSRQAIRLLTAAQRRQDDGQPWGEAVARASAASVR